uniref:F-box domain-containing protein n=1 Tax=Bursaphelenchus xylophilus TaxID=6326 RepID=A0A1I7RUG7_BURXY
MEKTKPILRSHCVICLSLHYIGATENDVLIAENLVRLSLVSPRFSQLVRIRIKQKTIQVLLDRRRFRLVLEDTEYDVSSFAVLQFFVSAFLSSEGTETVLFYADDPEMPESWVNSRNVGRIGRLFAEKLTNAKFQLRCPHYFPGCRARLYPLFEAISPRLSSIECRLEELYVWPESPRPSAFEEILARSICDENGPLLKVTLGVLPLLTDIRFIQPVEAIEVTIDFPEYEQPPYYFQPLFAIKAETINCKACLALNDFFCARYPTQERCKKLTCSANLLLVPFEGFYETIFDELKATLPNLESLEIMGKEVQSHELVLESLAVTAGLDAEVSQSYVFQS